MVSRLHAIGRTMAGRVTSPWRFLLTHAIPEQRAFLFIAFSTGAPSSSEVLSLRLRVVFRPWEEELTNGFTIGRATPWHSRTLGHKKRNVTLYGAIKYRSASRLTGGKA